MTGKELDRAFSLSQKSTPTEIWTKLKASRAARGALGPDLTTVRRALRGKTFKRGYKETRGAKAKLTALNLRSLNAARKRLIKQADNKAEVHLAQVMEEAGVDHVAESTVSKHFKEKLGVTWRVPRESPLRGPEEEKERVEICSTWKHYPNSYFTETVDGIMDNKVFERPTYAKAKIAAQVKRVRGHLRTRKEGITKGYTKPKGNKNRINPGGKVSVCAVIINHKVRVWHYLQSRWCGEAACDVYKDVLYPALRQYRGRKSAYRIVEDNDPTGYKSKAAVECKRALGIKPIRFPCYSPDLNPLDYFLWSEVSRRMAEQKPQSTETEAAFKTRLRATAMGIPKSTIKAAVSKMKGKAAEVVAAEGGRIKSD